MINVDELIGKLLGSFQELERCIEMTKEVLRGREDVDGDVLLRVDQYSDMVKKQRELAFQLEELIAQQNWDGVTRNVRLINAFSQMIRDDAQEILSNATQGKLPEGAERNDKFLV